jgi:hypothetical protein
VPVGDNDAAAGGDGLGRVANPFMYPAVPQEELVEWLLTDWWAKEGRLVAVEQLQLRHVQAAGSM